MSWANPLLDPADERLPRIAGPSGLIVFGVTGDLARNKLLPAAYDLANRGLLPPDFALVGFGRRRWDDTAFAQMVRQAVRDRSRTPFREEVWRQLAGGLRFVSGAFHEDEAFIRLRETLGELEVSRGTNGNFAFYLSVAPERYRDVVNQVGGEVFAADDVFRIDHYLGKETAQNILALQFANAMFEPLWNRTLVDHVQITMAEDIGIVGRNGFYDGVGAARDVIQNDLLQVLAPVAMEEPPSFDAESLAAEKLKVLDAVALPRDLRVLRHLCCLTRRWSCGGRRQHPTIRRRIRSWHIDGSPTAPQPRNPSPSLPPSPTPTPQETSSSPGRESPLAVRACGGPRPDAKQCYLCSGGGRGGQSHR